MKMFFSECKSAFLENSIFPRMLLLFVICALCVLQPILWINLYYRGVTFVGFVVLVWITLFFFHVAIQILTGCVKTEYIHIERCRVFVRNGACWLGGTWIIYIIIFSLFKILIEK